MAERELWRDYIIIEKDEEYYNAAVKRFAEEKNLLDC